MKEKILKYREEIDKLDEQILKLINKRAKCAIEIGKIKQQDSSSSIYVPQRKKQVINETILALL